MALYFSARFRIIDPGAVDRRHHGAGSHRIHANASIRVLESQRLRQVFHAALADGVAEVFRLGDDLMHARVVEDNPAAAVSREEMADRLPGAEERPPQVDPEDAVEIGGLDFVAGRRLLDSGVVHQDIQRAERLERPGKHGLHLVFLGNIRLNGQMFPSGVGLLRLRARLLGLFGAAAIIDGDVGALFGEPDRDGLPDARRRSGY